MLVENSDLNRLKYIAKEDSWRRYAQGTRSPQRVVERLADAGERLSEYDLDDFAKKITDIQSRLQCGERLPELIVVKAGTTI